MNPAAQTCEKSSWPTTRLTTPAYLRPRCATRAVRSVGGLHVRGQQ
ncbi:hypothetical protein HMPREF1980_01767 [Actinomyces sp. oral taxon 172 str. F0311]|nr:hypothetical protein HMPREF1980_01767 [Actinomyces sp. oral taxon 172 str. F0311]